MFILFNVFLMFYIMKYEGWNMVVSNSPIITIIQSGWMAKGSLLFLRLSRGICLAASSKSHSRKTSSFHFLYPLTGHFVYPLIVHWVFRIQIFPQGLTVGCFDSQLPVIVSVSLRRIPRFFFASSRWFKKDETTNSPIFSWKGVGFLNLGVPLAIIHLWDVPYYSHPAIGVPLF